MRKEVESKPAPMAYGEGTGNAGKSSHMNYQRKVERFIFWDVELWSTPAPAL